MSNIILTIGGSDTWGGGGISTDLKTFEKAHCFGLAALTCIAYEDQEKGFDIEALSPDLVKKQLKTLANAYKFSAIKIGLLNQVETIAHVKEFISQQSCPIIIDPVMVFKESSSQMCAYQAQLEDLMTGATLITPNWHEACILTGLEESASYLQIIDRLYEKFACPIYLKGGGRLEGDEAVDYLYDGQQLHILRSPKLHKMVINGAGCGLASMLACQLAKEKTLLEAAKISKQFIYQGILDYLPVEESVGILWNKNYC